MDKTFKVQFINVTTGVVFTLSTPYADRVEACVCGQNYCRDRQQEDGTVLFFRVVDPTEKNPYPQVHPICDNDCFDCPNCDSCPGENVDDPDWDDEEDSEEPDFTEFEELVNLIFGN